MIRGFLIAMAIVALGNQFSERIRLKQEEEILHKLPQEEAIGYFEFLKKRIRRVQIMRGLVLVAAVVMAFAYKKLVMPETGAKSEAAQTVPAEKIPADQAP